MRLRLTLVIVLLSLSAGQEALLACGDKFFLVGRGDRFSRAYATLHPGNILIYTGGTTPISKGLRDVRLHRFINRAGHRVLVAADRAELGKALESGSVDVILTGLDQAIDLVPAVASAPSKPTLLPIEGERSEGRGADQFAARLKSTDKVNKFLAGIEDVMKARPAPNRTRART